MRSGPGTRNAARHLGGAILPLIMLASSRPAAAQIGTPPPTFCGKTYVFAKAVPNGNVVAGVASSVTVNTVHFVNLLQFASGCQPGTISVTMTATLACEPDPDGGPTVFGPFTVPEGRTIIPISVPVPAGPKRDCTLVIVSRCTFADGMILEQSGDQTISVSDPAPGMPTEPQATLEVAQAGQDVKVAHPGDENPFEYQITNNDANCTLFGSVVVESRNSARFPLVVTSSTVTPSNGPFAVSGPKGEGAPRMKFQENLGGSTCVQLPNNPYEVFLPRIQKLIEVPPGQTSNYSWRVRHYPTNASGSMAEGTIRFDGFCGSSRVQSSAGFVAVADRLAASQQQCADSGTVATMTGSTLPGVGPSARMFSTLIGNATTAVYRAQLGLNVNQMQMLINGVPIGGGSNFSGITTVEGEWIIVNGEWSFVTPQPQPGDTVTMVLPFSLVSDSTVASRFNTTITNINYVPDAPLNYEDRFPYVAITANVDDTATANLDGTLYVTQQLRAIGVENGTFNGVDQQLTSFDIQQTGPNTYTITTDWTQLNQGSVPYVGFDVFSTIRANLTRAGREPLQAGGTATPDEACVGDAITLTGSATGGTPPYQFHWEIEFAMNEFQEVGSGQIVRHTPVIGDPGILPRVIHYRLRVTDAAANEAIVDPVNVDINCNRAIDIAQESAPGAGDFAAVQEGVVAVSTGVDDQRPRISGYWGWTQGEPWFHGAIGPHSPTDNKAHIWMSESANGLYLVAVLDAPATATGGSADYSITVSGDAAAGTSFAFLDDCIRHDDDDAYSVVVVPGQKTYNIQQTWTAGQTDGVAIGPFVGAFQADVAFNALGGTTPLDGAIVAGVNPQSGQVTLASLPLQLGRHIRLTGTIPVRLGDMNCNGDAGPDDVDPFVLALLDPQAYAAMFPGCNIQNADYSGDGDANGLDIPLFVKAMLD